MAVVCNVYDLKVSNVEIFEINKFAGYFSSVYGGLILHKGKVYESLRMDLNYSKQGTVKASMIKYVNSVLQEFPDNLGAEASNPGC